MIGNRYNGDSIAESFQKILNKNKELNKKARALFESSAEDDPAEAILNHEPEGDILPDPESFLMSLEDHESDDVSSALDGNIKAFESESDACEVCGQKNCECYNEASDSEFFSANAAHILNGLGKIAGSLKAKGEFFASDMVEATAMSVKNDFVKEASDRAMVTSELKKIAKELSDSGDNMASDMVMVTINKIKNG